MSRPYTSVEAENRTAFLVQLSGLLTQVSMTVNSTALSSASKAKLTEVSTAVEEWVKEIGDVTAPKPTAAAAAPSTSKGAAAATSADASLPSPHQEAGEPMPDARSADAKPAGEEAHEVANGSAAAAESDDESVAATVDAAASRSASGAAAESASVPPPPTTPIGGMEAEAADGASACQVGSKNIRDVIALMELLFTSGIPESPRLRVMAKALARLVSVRCASIISAALQHVLHLTYVVPRVGATAPTSPQTPSTASPSTAATVAQLQALFVALARDMRVAARTLVRCLEVMSQNTDLADPSSVRLPMQLCLDALKQARRSLNLFQSRVIKEEAAQARAALQAASTSPLGEDEEGVAALREALMEEDEGPELSPRAEALVAARVAALRALWGPSLTYGLVVVGGVVHTAVGFLCSVAAVKELGAPADLATLRLNAQNDLFALCDTLPPPFVGAKAAAGRNGEAGDPPRSRLASPLSAEDAVGRTLSDSGPTAARGTDGDEPEADAAASLIADCARAMAAAIPLRMGVAYQAEYLAAVAQRCGDEDDGRLVATRILTDALRHLSLRDPALLIHMVARSSWRKPLLSGMLNCLVSLQPAVLSAGLDGLRVIVTTCRGVLGQEIGMLYSSCVFRLLDSDNSPQFVKRQILLHLLMTFLNPRSSGGGGVDQARRMSSRNSSSDTLERGQEESTTRRRNTRAPLLLHLYRAYDLNAHAHQLNIVQQFIMALSRIVRQAPRHEFAMDAAAHKALLQAQQQRADAQGASASPTSTSAATPADLFMLQQSLPSIALHGLLLTVETMVRQAPLEDDTGRDVLALLPNIDNRARKLEEQRQVDIFNTSPKKAIQKMFNVQPEEMSPPGTEEWVALCEHHTLPVPATPATAAKVSAVADFLLTINSLSPESVAEYLSTPAVFPLQVCDVYMSRLHLAGRGVVDAVKELLGTVQLPKEGQRIERMLEFFCAAYYRANDVPGIDRDTLFPFANEQACLLLVVSVVMLNTALHNPKAGQQMTPYTFRRQLAKCNNEKNFADFFLNDIFSSISRQPLTEVKSVGAATLGSSNHNSTSSAGEPHRGFDALFISSEERRRLTFGLERQRLVSETRYLMDRRYRLPPLASREDWTWYCGATRDLFLASWSHVCAVFGPAMYEGSSPSEEVLVKCIRGLQALMCMGASFALSTECEVTMLALLRMCEFDAVKEACVGAVLAVASTAYAVHLSPRCWYAVFSLLVTLRKESSPMLARAENVLARVESLTRLSCEDRERMAREEAAATVAVEATTTAAETPSIAVQRVLEGVLDLLRDVSPENAAATLGAGLYFLKRCLGYSVIAHGSRGAADVVHCMSVHHVAKVVVPRLVSMVRRHATDDDTLQKLMGFAVEMLGDVWSSHSVRQYTVEQPHASSSPSPSPASASASSPGEATRYVTVDSAPVEFVECFEFFKQCYDVQGSGTGSAAGALVKTHLLQAAKDLMTLTMRAVEFGAQPCQLSLYTVIAAWRRVLYPVARALSDKQSASTEVCGLAGLVLRKLTALSCGTGSSTATLIPASVRTAALSLLADVAYIGCMRSDVDSAQECLSRLVAICTTALTAPAALGTLAASSSPPPSGAERAWVASLVARCEADKLGHRMVTGIQAEPHYAAAHALERLTLLLRCNREQTRAEAVESLRTLCVQLPAAQARHVALQLSEVVLEATVGHATPHYEVALSDPSLVSFWVFLLEVPPTMKRCSRTAFRATLPGALGFMVGELLSILSPAHLAEVANVVMSRCLVPIIVAPSVTAFPSRSLAARCLTQCAMVCLSRGAQNIVGADASRASTTAAMSPSASAITPVTCVLRCAALVLQRIQVPTDGLVPMGADFVGRDWPLHQPPGDARAEEGEELYRRAVSDAMASLTLSSPQQIAGNTRHASLSRGPPLSSSAKCPPQQQRPADTGAAAAATRVVTDEELVEYCGFLVQILPGLPKVLHSRGHEGEGEDEEVQRLLRLRDAAASAAATPCSVESGWAPPPVPVEVLLRSLLRAAHCLFAALWRVMHPHEMNLFFQQLQGSHSNTDGVAGMPTFKMSAALLPHAAVRGVLNSYIELALRSAGCRPDQLLTVTVDILRGMSALQSGTQQHSSASSGASEGAGLASVLQQQRLSPQEQQHMRTCAVGMYQELSVVLGYWMKLFLQPAPSPHSGGSQAPLAAARREAVRQLALSPQLFSALVDLLTPTAGAVIVTVRDYLAWFILQKQLTSPQPQPQPSLSTGLARNSAATVDAEERVDAGSRPVAGAHHQIEAATAATAPGMRTTPASSQSSRVVVNGADDGPEDGLQLKGPVKPLLTAEEEMVL